MREAREHHGRILPWLLLAVAVLAGAAVLLLQGRPGERTLYEGATEFGAIRVTERRDGVRLLRLGEGRAVQTAMNPSQPTVLQSPYTQVAMVGLALAPADGRMLFVGLGGGAMPTFARQVRPRARLDAVEIDPGVIDAAVTWFGLQPDSLLHVHAADGRRFIEDAPPRQWDVIFLDAFSDDAIPISLATREFLEAVRTRLAPGGVVVSNLWTRSPLHEAMVATYLAVFSEVVSVAVPGRAQHILISADDDRSLRRDSVVAAARAFAAAAHPGYDAEALVRNGYRGRPEAAGPVLTDSAGPPVSQVGAVIGALAAARSTSAATSARRYSPF